MKKGPVFAGVVGTVALLSSAAALCFYPGTAELATAPQSIAFKDNGNGLQFDKPQSPGTTAAPSPTVTASAPGRVAAPADAAPPLRLADNNSAPSAVAVPSAAAPGNHGAAPDTEDVSAPTSLPNNAPVVSNFSGFDTDGAAPAQDPDAGSPGIGALASLSVPSLGSGWGGTSPTSTSSSGNQGGSSTTPTPTSTTSPAGSQDPTDTPAVATTPTQSTSASSTNSGSTTSTQTTSSGSNTNSGSTTSTQTTSSASNTNSGSTTTAQTTSSGSNTNSGSTTSTQTTSSASNTNSGSTTTAQTTSSASNTNSGSTTSGGTSGGSNPGTTASNPPGSNPSNPIEPIQTTADGSDILPVSNCVSNDCWEFFDPPSVIGYDVTVLPGADFSITGIELPSNDNDSNPVTFNIDSCTGDPTVCVTYTVANDDNEVLFSSGLDEFQMLATDPSAIDQDDALGFVIGLELTGTADIDDVSAQSAQQFIEITPIYDPVPEPASLALFAGALLMGWRVRRRRS